jgi:hypothetical protein
VASYGRSYLASIFGVKWVFVKRTLKEISVVNPEIKLNKKFRPRKQSGVMTGTRGHATP